MRFTTAVLSALTIALATTVSSAETGWPKWLGPEGTGVSTETGLAESWPEGGPKKLWEFSVGIGYSSPVALDGKIYFFAQEGSKDTLRCFEADSGKVLWTQSYDREGDFNYPGTRATPTIENNRIYTHGSAGDLVCRELADGALVWRTNVLKETNAKPINWGSASSPLISGDHIFVQCGMEGDATAVCVDKKTGKLVWKSEAKSQAGYSSLILIDAGSSQQLVVYAGDRVYGMDPKSGKTLWTETFKADYDVTAATPVFRAPHLLITATRRPGAMVLSVTPDGTKKLFEKPSVASKFQPPILDGNLLFANSNGVLTCVTWPDLEVKWTARGRELNLGPGGSLVRVGDKLITLSERGRLSLVRAAESEGKLISQVQLFDYSQVWSTPMIYRGKLYCKGEKDLVCLDIAAK
jgi:outer membrane protein assembly factor BamB